MSKLPRLGLLLALVTAVCAFLQPAAAGAVAAADRAGAVAAAAVPSADSATSPSPAEDGPGARDGDRDDWDGIRWLFLGLLIPVVFIGGVILAKKYGSSSRK
ncbi:hypothetical protein [Kribbella sp. CA-294648]|uniref:hypothetical protein n=1 Tax=Kribbella sp. CA-294648 TaxID=3239948 RepID=UPI003D92A709